MKTFSPWGDIPALRISAGTTSKRVWNHTLSQNENINYLELPCSFDLENSNIKIQDGIITPVYLWQLAIGHDAALFYGRDIGDFPEALSLLQKRLNLSRTRRLVIYVHNLGYEFQFIKDLVLLTGDMFALEPHKPVKFLTDYGIEFRCSLALSGGQSLASVARNLIHHQIEKLPDFDHSKHRTPETPLTEREWEYAANDVRIITAYISEQLTTYKTLHKIPPTNTGRVRESVKQATLGDDNTSREEKNRMRRLNNQIMRKNEMDRESYIMQNNAKVGGFTHASRAKVDQVIKEVFDKDITSAYPLIICSGLFPMEEPKPRPCNTVEELNSISESEYVIFKAEFQNIRQKDGIPDAYWSEHKCQDVLNPKLDNGRIISADHLVCTLINQTWEVMQLAYDWDSVTILDLRTAPQSYLPKPIIMATLKYFSDKTELSGVEGRESDYMLSKNMLNSVYGMMLTDPLREETSYSPEVGWETEFPDIDEALRKYSEKKDRVLAYHWGIVIPAAIQLKLWRIISRLGSDYIYSDTDSIKYLNKTTHQALFERDDKATISSLETMASILNIDRSLLRPKKPSGAECILGLWEDVEGTPYRRLKTLGAKRYMTEDRNGKLKTTVAGIGKNNLLNYIMSLSGGSASAAFELFSAGLEVPAEYSGKLQHTYIDHPQTATVTDYLGNTSTVTVLSGVSLEPIPFKLDRGVEYAALLDTLNSDGRVCSITPEI